MTTTSQNIETRVHHIPLAEVLSDAMHGTTPVWN